MRVYELPVESRPLLTIIPLLQFSHYSLVALFPLGLRLVCPEIKLVSHLRQLRKNYETNYSVFSMAIFKSIALPVLATINCFDIGRVHPTICIKNK